MNELMVVIDCMDWIYYKTEKLTVHEALAELSLKLDSIGVDADNMIYIQCELRNEEGEIIDEEEDW